MRRTVLVLAAMALALTVASGVALAVSKTGTNGDDVLEGTFGKDALAGGGGDDRLYGRQGKDRVYGDSGRDRVFGNIGNDQLFGGGGDDDFINLLDERGGDVAVCGEGFDEVYGDFGDETDRDDTCEYEFQVIVEPFSSLQSNAGRLGPEEPEAMPEDTFVTK
jgi:hypothetical protein